MSVQASSWVWDYSHARGPDFQVLHAIANEADTDGRNAWPSIARVARMARVSESTVKRSIRRLVELGELEVEENAGGHEVMRADRRPNRYRVLMTRRRSVHTPARRSEGPGGTPVSKADANPQVTGAAPATLSDDRSDRTPVPAAEGHEGSDPTPRGVSDDRTGGHSCDPQPTPDPTTTHPDAACGSDARDRAPEPPPPLDHLRDELAAAGLDASWTTCTSTELTEVAALVDRHGVARLVDAARLRHRPGSPAGHARAWFADWRGLRTVRLDHGPTRPPWCGSCSETTRLLDIDDDRGVRRCPDCHPEAQRGAA